MLQSRGGFLTVIPIAEGDQQLQWLTSRSSEHDEQLWQEEIESLSKQLEIRSRNRNRSSVGLVPSARCHNEKLARRYRASHHKVAFLIMGIILTSFALCRWLYRGVSRLHDCGLSCKIRLSPLWCDNSL
jgi:hypothetical protein